MVDRADRQAEAAPEHLARNLIGLRQARGLTQQALARSAGVPRSTVATLESGAGNPSLQVLVKVATALAVPIDELLASPRAKVRHYRESELAERQRSGRGVTMRPLVPEPTPAELLALMSFAPHATFGGSPHLPGTREFFTCLEGRIVMVVAGERHELSPGEVLAFPGNVAHSYQNPDPTPARGVSVVVLARLGV